MDPIQAIGSFNVSGAERLRAHSEMMNLQVCERTPAGESAACDIKVRGAHLTPYVAPLPEPPSKLNVKSAADQFSDGLKKGFYTTELENYVKKARESTRPGNKVNASDLHTDLLDLHARMGIADACTKVSTKLAESLQSVVTKQG
jgi:hypothetical protein